MCVKYNKCVVVRAFGAAKLSARFRMPSLSSRVGRNRLSFRAFVLVKTRPY